MPSNLVMFKVKERLKFKLNRLRVLMDLIHNKKYFKFVVIIYDNILNPWSLILSCYVMSRYKFKFNMESFEILVTQFPLSSKCNQREFRMGKAG